MFETDSERYGGRSSDDGVEPTSAPGVPKFTATGTTPPVLLETLDGTSNWSDWGFHFEHMTVVNGWDGAQKLKWLRVRLTRRAQKALHHLPEVTAATYHATQNALQAQLTRIHVRLGTQQSFKRNVRRP